MNISSATNTERIVAETCVRISSSVYVRRFGEEMVLLDFGRGEYFGLDEVGAEIWRHLEAGESLSVVADAIVARYDVDREAALHDIVDLVASMSRKSLLTVLDATAS